MRACHAAGTEWNCRSEQSNLVARGDRGTPGGGGFAPYPVSPQPPGAHRPLCSWMCSVVKGSVRIR